MLYTSKNNVYRFAVNRAIISAQLGPYVTYMIQYFNVS